MIRIVVVLIFLFKSFFIFAQEINQTGWCSYYADKFHGRNTASGEKYDKNLYTAAHRTLPFNTFVEVTNLRNQKKTVVKINDRGPNTKNRILDVSKAAATDIDMLLSGIDKIEIKVLPDSFNIMNRYTNIENVYKPDSILPDSDKEAKLIYDVGIKTCNLNGYGIQMGYYKIFENCKTAQKKYMVKYKVEGYIFVEKKGKTEYYRLILGNYVCKSEAINLQAILKKEVPGCFIVNWGKL
ncbi:MAG: septal ring lytic transglycosylase RlpA family protein [Bacteroidales bacterium]|nr:septal ring lytic transglycosylase RlpA family protein [Bacteroidales bacterium]MDD4214038.1 septal ring lytic transglycosylase RlpA family protein [Bacteroidales bacterium]